MKRTRITTLLAAAAGMVLLVSGCGGPDPIEQLEDALDAANEEQTQDDDIDEAGEVAEAEEAGGDLGPLPVEPQQVGATVYMGGLEYTVESLDVIDLDAESDRQMRMQGAQVVLSGSVVNPSTDTASPNAPFTLQWQDEAGHTYQSSGLQTPAPIPGGASGPLESEVTLTPDQLETFDAGSAVVLVGSEGRSPAQIPLGDQGELIDRIPVPQPGLIGQTFDVNGQLEATITEADLVWHGDGSSTEDGTGILEIFVEVQNNTDSQQCWRRGTGTNFMLVAADGTGTADLSMSDRGCATSGGSVTSLTGIPVYEDYAGDYTLTLDYEIRAGEEYQVPVEFTMVTEPAVLFSER